MGMPIEGFYQKLDSNDRPRMIEDNFIYYIAWGVYFMGLFTVIVNKEIQ